ncbi:hypothetical protein MHU86_1115 [Fragilaria crotonensis]|nr:hypothetical protein MHU86_1115 [Fragilaria crotonensis]
MPHVARVHIVPAMQTASLLSMGQLCDASFGHLRRHLRQCSPQPCMLSSYMAITPPHRFMASRPRHPRLAHSTNGSYRPTPFPRCGAQQCTALAATVADTTPADLVAFTHASLFPRALYNQNRAQPRFPA